MLPVSRALAALIWIPVLWTAFGLIGDAVERVVDEAGVVVAGVEEGARD